MAPIQKTDLNVDTERDEKANDEVEEKKEEADQTRGVDDTQLANDE